MVLHSFSSAQREEANNKHLFLFLAHSRFFSTHLSCSVLLYDSYYYSSHFTGCDNHSRCNRKFKSCRKVDQPVKVDEWQSLLLGIMAPTEFVDVCEWLDEDGIDDNNS